MKTNPHILLADDDHIFCMVMEEILSKAGYSVTTASNGKKALSLLSDHPARFALIILDRVMPESSGLEVLKKLCHIPTAREIPVILLTARTGIKNTENAVKYGVFDILKKPIDETRLLKAVEKALGYRHCEPR